MRKTLLKTSLMVALAAVAVSCGTNTNNAGEVLEINNALTDAQKQAGILTPEVMWKMGRVGAPTLSPDGKTVLYGVTNYNMGENKGVTSFFVLPYEGGEPVLINDAAGNDSDPVWIDNDNIMFLSDRSGDGQIWKMNVSTKKTHQITKLEGGIDAFGLAPSKDKVFYIQSIAVTKVASSEVHPDMDKSKALIYDDLMERHWNYWDKGSYRHIFVADINVDAPGKDIMEGEAWDAPTAPYFDASEIAWNNAGTKLAYTCKKLTGKDYAVSTNTDIYVYDVQSGETVNMTEGMVGYDKYPRFSADDKSIAFLSMERAGNESDKNRLFIMNVESGEKQYLTSDFDYNADNVVWSGNDELYFIAPMNATYQVCRVKVGSEVDVVTVGDHDIISLDKVGDNIVTGIQSISRPVELFSVAIDGSLKQITNTNKEIYESVKMGEVQKRFVKTTDGKDMLTWVVLPPNFDATQKYPVLLYCQGGPQNTVSQFWSYRWNFQLMAAQGYIVVAPNRRGLPSFGQEWLDQISGDYSGQNIKDYLCAIDDVAKEPWADETRMGCIGASYGGYSTYFLAGNHEKRFKAFISHCGMFNFESFYGSTEELWFPGNDLGGPYWDKNNKTAQRSYANSPHKFVDKWDTPILIFVGLNDFRIPYAESLQAFTAARMKGLPSRLVAFENEAHQVFKPQNSLVWNREFFGWLDKYVKNAE